MNIDPVRPESTDSQEPGGHTPDTDLFADVRTAERPHEDALRPESRGGELVAVRRNLLLSNAVGGLATLIAIAYLVRSASFVDTAIGFGLLAIAVVHLSALTSARMPVLVADDQGIRLRVGLTWRGLPWGSIRQVVVEHADSPLREGRVVVVPRDPEAVLGDQGPLAGAHLRWNRFWYGAPLSVPLGITTVIDTLDLAGDLGLLARGRTDVVNLRGRDLARLDEVETRRPRESFDLPAPDEDGLLVPDEDGLLVPDEDGFIALQPIADQPVLVDEVAHEPEPALPEPVSPLRDLRQPTRVEVRLDQSARGDAGVPAQRLPDQVTAWEELPVEVVIDDLAPSAPVAEPVIGPKVLHAREMLDMSIEELSQRTRIRPHVLEAIEVDDFGPCGGDFYARGHLTAIARVLGLTLEPLMKTYDERYAHGPINARRVFEADLSTGLSGGMRATLGGPRWSLLIGSVLCLAMVWGLARLFAGAPEQLSAAPDPNTQIAGLTAHHQPITSPLMRTTPMTVTAAHAGANVVVRDRTGRILWSGPLPMTHSRHVVGLAPFNVSADNAGAVEVTVKGAALGTIGMAGAAGSKKFG